MEKPVYTFLPTNTSDNLSFWASRSVIPGIALFFLLEGVQEMLTADRCFWHCWSFLH